MSIKIVSCGIEYAPQILAILNEAIVNTRALYEYHPRTLESMTEWFAEKAAGKYPVIGAVNDDDVLMGFATYGSFRWRPAYKYTVEDSLYVEKRFRGQGVATRLMQELIDAAKSQDYHVVVGGIDSTNEPSIALHKKFGFRFCGRIEHAGFKFGQWMDLDFYQLILPTPAMPVDG
ncbi:MAG: N-acetyltransferase [Pirellulales bacterium]|nr:N-acetyltransferase [Pirellulales bacterium]